MLCIIAFITFLILFPILGFFPEYRRLFRRAWECVFKKITLKPCDINLGEEIKSKILGKLIFKAPKLAKFLDKTFTFWALAFVILNIWSLTSVALSGLNLWVYDTCTPSDSQGCSLSGEACGLSGTEISFSDAVENNQLGQWVTQPWTTLGKTLQRVPDRWKNWQATDYLGQKPTYYNSYDPNKQTAVEFIDPGCQYCKKLFENIKQANFESKYNLTYVVYPIKDSTNTSSGGYKFQASQTIAKYLEAIKEVPIDNDSKVSPDWQLIETIFTDPGSNGSNLQNQFNFIMSKKDIAPNIEKILKKIGYSDSQIQEIRIKSESSEVASRLEENRNIVENKVKTIKIPTIIFNGRRYDRVIGPETLK